MTQTLELPDIPDELLHKLDERLRNTGQDRAAYVIHLMERDLRSPTLSELLAPLRMQVAASGMSEQQLDELFQNARTEVYQEGLEESIER